jgi:hypothetical protein
MSDFVTEKTSWDWLQAHMPDEVATALRLFVSVNPSYNGAQWWDCLSVLRDSDSFLDVIDPMAEQVPEWGTLHSFVTLTLIFASRMFHDATTDERVILVRATIANNSR